MHNFGGILVSEILPLDDQSYASGFIKSAEQAQQKQTEEIFELITEQKVDEFLVWNWENDACRC